MVSPIISMGFHGGVVSEQLHLLLSLCQTNSIKVVAALLKAFDHGSSQAQNTLVSLTSQHIYRHGFHCVSNTFGEPHARTSPTQAAGPTS